MTKKQPAYLLIKNAILDNIHKGVWVVNTAIPTEMALCEQFGVSRMTVNRALKELTDERVLERRQGSGTFVAQQKYSHTFIEIRNIAKDIAETGKAYRASVLTQKNLADNELTDELVVVFGAECAVCQVNIVHYGDGVPIQFEERFVNANLVPEFIAQDFTVMNTSDYLIAQVPLESGKYAIGATMPTAPIAQALAMDDDEPALLLTRTTYSQGQAVTLVKMWYAGGRYEFGGRL